MIIAGYYVLFVMKCLENCDKLEVVHNLPNSLVFFNGSRTLFPVHMQHSYNRFNKAHT